MAYNREEWYHTLSQLNRTNRRALRRIIYTRLIQHRFRLPLPINFAVRVAIFSFLLLTIFPSQPASIPIAFGGALSFSLIISGIIK